MGYIVHLLFPYSIHPFHPEVGDQHIELLALELVEGVLRAVRAHRSIALRFKDFTAQAGQNFMIIDKQNGFHRAPVANCRGDTPPTLYIWFRAGCEKMPEHAAICGKEEQNWVDRNSEGRRFAVVAAVTDGAFPRNPVAIPA